MMINQTRANPVARRNASVSIIRPLARIGLWLRSTTIGAVFTLAFLPSAIGKPLVVSGQIEAYEVHISVPAPLRVTAVNAKEGDTVTKGQVLLELDASEVQARRDGASKVLSVLAKEREQINSSIALLQKTAPNTTENLKVAGSLKKRSSDPTSPRTVANPESHAQSARSQPQNALMSAQLQNLDEEYRVQTSELDDAYGRELKMLESTIKANSDAADKGYAAQLSALKEVGKAKLEVANKHSFFSFLVPRKLRDVRAQAITEVVNAEESALTQGFQHSKEGLRLVGDAQRKAAQESYEAKKKALAESYKAKRTAIEQTQTVIDALQKSAAEQQNQIRKQLASFQAGFADSQGRAQGGIGSLVTASQSGVLRLELESARNRLVAVDSEIAKVKAGQLEVEAKGKMLKVSSPLDGRLSTSNVHVGELPIPGQNIMTIIDPNRLYLRTYIPEALLGGIRVGQQARVHLDYKQAPEMEATVTSIDEQAAFTPENISLPQDRVRQVFGVKLQLKNAGSFAKPGMPADATFDVD
jgi:HlyD family secretion protein